MPSYVFKRPPSGIADYKLIQDGDKYAFFGSSIASASMGTIINYSVAAAIINQSTSWAPITEAIYDSKREAVLGSLELTPSDIFDQPDVRSPLTYFQYEPPSGGGLTWFCILTGETAFETSFSEAVTYNERTLEYTILRNFNETYNNTLLNFLNKNGKIFSSKEYNSWRAATYKAIGTDGKDGGGIVLPPFEADLG